MILLRSTFFAVLVGCGGGDDLPAYSGNTDAPVADDPVDTSAPVDTSVPVDTDTDAPIDTDTGTPRDTDTGAPTALGCGTQAPVVTGVAVSNGGLIDPGTGADVPSLLFVIDVTDADGDLHEVGFEIDIDPTVDGTLSPTAMLAGSGTVPVAPCGAPGLQLQLNFVVDGGTMSFDSHYEFGVRVSDAAGNASNTFLVDAITPNADGTDGDGV